MTVARSVADVLDDHVVFEVEWNVPDFIDTGLGCQVGEFSEA